MDALRRDPDFRSLFPMVNGLKAVTAGKLLAPEVVLKYV